MTKKVTCPFSKTACTECSLYRAKHHHLSLSMQDRSILRRSGGAKSHRLAISAEFEALNRSVERSDRKRGRTTEPKIRVKVIDMETKATRICEVKELKGWDWSDPSLWRLIDGWQVRDLNRLMEILNSKAEMGCEEVEVCEAPRFMMLAGG
jgi:hypothetical protein